MTSHESGDAFTVGRANARQRGAQRIVDADVSEASSAFTSRSAADDTSKAKPVSLAKGLGRLASVRNIRRDSNKQEEASKGSNAVSPSSEKKKRTLKYGFSLKAREYIAVGFYEQAIVCSQKANDIVGWSVALMLSSEAEKAVDIIEAFIITSCLVTYQEIHKGIGGAKFDYKQILASIVGGPGAPNTVDIMQSLPPPTESLYRQTIEEVCETADWEELHQWYLVAVLLHRDYTPPTNTWLKQFFGLYPVRRRNSGGGNPGERRRTSRSQDPRHARTALPPSRNLTRADVENILLSQCTTSEIHQVNATVAYCLQRFRLCMKSATEAIKEEPDDIQMRFMRCMCANYLCERQVVSEDSTRLMQSASMLVSTVGCALATFGIPLASARAGVESFRSSDEEQNYVYTLCELVHSTSLLHVGQFEAAIKVVEHAMPVAVKCKMTEPLMDVLTTCCIAIEDSECLLKWRQFLSPFQQLHIALVPRFGGGYENDSINQISIDSAVGELLNPLNVGMLNDVRQMIAIHVTTARSLFSFGHLREAWLEVCSACTAAEELIGSATFALSDCSPHRVLFLGCTIGMTLLDRLIDEDDENTKKLTPTQLLEQRMLDDALGDDIIGTCRAWARIIRDFHPNMILGHAAITQVSVASHDVDSMERAVAMAEHFPDHIITQNALSYALYAKHLIPDAIAHAQKTLQRFPHVQEAENMAFAVSGKEGTYTFLYRGMLPFSYGSGNVDSTTWRLWLAFCITLLNFAILIGILVCNFGIPFPLAADSTVRRLQLPSMIPYFAAAGAFLYSMAATFVQPTLVSVLLTDLHVRNTRLNRFLYSSRLLPWINVANAVQISVFGNNFEFDSMWYTIALYAALACLQFPYSSRTFFLRSHDEPRMALPFWITLLAVDFTVFLVVSPLLFIAALIEPVMFVAFIFFPPALPPSFATGDIVQRLMTHTRWLRDGNGRDWRFDTTSGSTFPHIELMKLLFFKTHSEMETQFLSDIQLEEDDMRVFPLIEILEEIALEPLPLPKPALDPEMQKIVERQRIRSLVEIGEAKLGEGNLAGILDDDDMAVDDDLDMEYLSSSPVGKAGSFSADVMEVLNAEFAKLQTINTTIKEAETAKNSEKGVAQGEGKKLGDVGLYRENKEKTDMLTSGPMMRQMFQKNGRKSVVAADGVATTPRAGGPTFNDARVGAGAPAHAAGVSPRSRQSNTSFAPSMDSGAASSSHSIAQGTALLKAGMARKQSLFRGREATAFLIDDDMKPATSATVNRSNMAQMTASAAPTLRTTAKRPSFGVVLEDDSGSSSSFNTDDDSDTAPTPQPKPLLSQPAVTASPKPLSPEPSKAAGASKESHIAIADAAPQRSSLSHDMIDGNVEKVHSVGDMTFGDGESEHSAADGTSQTHSRVESMHTLSDASPNVKRHAPRNAVSFLVEVAQSGATSVSSSVAVDSIGDPMSQGSIPSEAQPRFGNPKQVSMPGESGSTASTTHVPRMTKNAEPPSAASSASSQASLASAFSVQLQRKQSALMEERRGMMEGMAPVEAVKRKFSLRDVVSSISPPPVATASSDPKPAFARRSSTVRFSSQSETPDAGQRTNSTSPESTAAAAQPRRMSSAPPARYDVPGADSSAEDSSIKPVNGNLKVKKLLEDLRFSMTSVQDASNAVNKGIVIDEPTLQILRKQVEQSKLKFVSELQKIGPRVAVDTFDTKKQLGELFVELVLEGERRAGNQDVVMAMLTVITSVDFSILIHTKNLLNNALCKGNARMLMSMLLHKPILSLLSSSQMTAFLESWPSWTEKRCSVLLALLEVAERSKHCQSAASEMQLLWQDTLEKVVSLQQALPDEDRSDLPALLTTALRHPFIRLSAEVESVDKQTIFSRACREGDLVTVSTLLKNNLVQDMNRVQSDGTNALQQAAARNCVDVVQLLVSQPHARTGIAHAHPSRGTALEVAISLKRDQRIIDLLSASASAQRSASPVVSSTEASLAQQLTLLVRKLQECDGAPQDVRKGLDLEATSVKDAAIKAIDGLLPPVEWPASAALASQVHNALEKLIREGDARVVNVKLIKALVARFALHGHLPVVCLERQWLVVAAENGFAELMRVLLSMTGLQDAIKQDKGRTVTKIVEAITRCRTSRYPLITVVLDHAATLALAESAADAKDVWQRLVTELCSVAHARPAELKMPERLPPLIARILTMPTQIGPLDFETEQGLSDHHTIFSRAAADGLVDLLDVLVQARVIKNPNRCQSDGRCALTSAIAANRVAAVEFLLSVDAWQGVLNVNLQTGEGRVLDVARLHNADARIVQALIRAGAQ